MVQLQILSTEKHAKIGGECGELLVTRLFCAAIVSEKWQKCRRKWAVHIFLSRFQRMHHKFKGIYEEVRIAKVP